MGYKRAGYEVIAANDLDPEMARHYKANLNPKHYFPCPIGDLIERNDLPAELYDLDVLDGSPPCSTFSMSGDREKAWGKLKHFREGQSKQVLSDLFFDYLNLVEKLRPKVAIAENVRGMIHGNAKGYVRLVFERFKEIGYRPQLFLLNAADCGVPQSRERVFFCALRDDLPGGKLVLRPQAKRISCREATSDLQALTEEELQQTRPAPSDRRLWHLIEGGSDYGKAHELLGEKVTQFNHIKLAADKPANTLTASCRGTITHWGECRKLSTREIARLGSFPDDYKFANHTIAGYLVGMSVPPKMTEYVARQVAAQWLNHART